MPIKIHDIKNFSDSIEKLTAKGLSYMEAIIECSRTLDIDDASIAKLLSDKIKKKLRKESEDHNLLKKRSRFSNL